MAKMKFCEVGKHEVSQLWKAKRINKATGEVLQHACCKNCMSRTPIKNNPSSKLKTEVKKKLNVFFAEQSLVFPERCENCGERLDKSSAFSRRSQTCHILPKSENSGFPSVATHPSNKVFMCCFGGCYGHGKYDYNDANTRKSMPVYQLAIERFRSFENHLTEKEKINAYKYLGLSF